MYRKSIAVSCNEQYGDESLRSYIRLATKAQYWAYRSYVERLGFPRHSRRLLDYGAGIGSLMLIARELGWDVYGVDPSPYAGWAREHLGLDIFVGHLDASPYPDGFFDVIVTLSTLEHIYHLKHELDVIYRKLRPGGIFVAGGVPNFDSFENVMIRKFTKNWDLILGNNPPPAHINFLTPRTMRMLVERTGFSRVKVDTYGIKWVSEKRHEAWEQAEPSHKNADPQMDLSHPFLDSSPFIRNLGVRDIVFKWMVGMYMNFRVPLWGDKLLVIAEK